MELLFYQPLTPNDTAIRRQGITNLTCRDSSQWLTANPDFIFNKMSDAAFKTCYHLRHMFPVLGYVAPRGYKIAYYQIVMVVLVRVEGSVIRPGTWRYTVNRLLRGSCLGVSANHSAQPNEEHSA